MTFSTAPNMIKQQQHESRCVSSVSLAAVPRDVVPENDGACSSETVNGARWKLSRSPHFAALQERRNQPGNCRRCGKPNDSENAHCSRCSEYQKSYRQRAKNMRLTVPTEVALEIAQFRRELDRLRGIVLTMRSKWRAAYRKGYLAGKAGKRARFKSLAWLPPELSAEDRAMVSHRFDAAPE